MKNLCLVIVMLFAIVSSYAQESNSKLGASLHLGMSNDFKRPQNKEVFDYTNTYAGLSYGFDVFYTKNHFIMSLMYLGSSELGGQEFFDADHPYQRTNQGNFMMGYTTMGNIRFTAQTGVGVNWGFLRGPQTCTYMVDEEEPNFTTIGLPVKVGVESYYSERGGTGYYFLTNLNSESTTWGVLISWKFGRLGG